METREKDSPRKPTKLVVSVVQAVGASKIVEEVIKDLADKRIASFLDGPNPFHITKVPSIIDFLAVPRYDTHQISCLNDSH